MTPLVWALSVTHRHGVNLGIFMTEEEAWANLADYVDGEWEQEIAALEDAPEKPADREEMIEVYFQEMEDEEQFTHRARRKSSVLHAAEAACPKCDLRFALPLHLGIVGRGEERPPSGNPVGRDEWVQIVKQWTAALKKGRS